MKHPKNYLPCLICGVDSGPIKAVLYTIFGSLVLSSLFIFLWAWFSGKFRKTEELSGFAIKAENVENKESVDGK